MKLNQQLIYSYVLHRMNFILKIILRHPIAIEYDRNASLFLFCCLIHSKRLMNNIFSLQGYHRAGVITVLRRYRREAFGFVHRGNTSLLL